MAAAGSCSTPKIFVKAMKLAICAPPPDPGKLQHRSHQRHGQQQHGARKIHIGVQEGFSEGLGNPQINQRRKHPVQRGVENGRQQVGSGANGLQPFADSRNGRSEAAPETARGAPTLQSAIHDRRAMQAVVDQKCNQASHRGRAAASRRCCALSTQFISAPASDKRFGKTSKARQARTAAAEKSQNRSKKKIPNMLATGRRSLRARMQRADGLAGAPQNKNGRKAHQRAGIRVQEIGGADVPAEALPADRADRVTRVNPDQAKQKKQNIRLADAGDEFPPGKVGQMNLMARVIGERHHARQNQQRDEYPTESSTHSQARLTAAGTGCQERRCAYVLNGADALLMVD